MRNCFAVTAAILAAFAVSTTLQAGPPGAAPAGTAIAMYDAATGNIQVSVSGVNNWYVEDTNENVMTGDSPQPPLPNNGGLVTDNDIRIGESNFGTFSFTDLNLGDVAATGLADDGTLQIFWNTGLGTTLQDQPVAFAGGGGGGTPPTAAINGPFSINIGIDPLNILLDASASTGDPTLMYKWDLDNDSIFETDTGSTATLNIPSVTAQFGSVVPTVHTVTVMVTNSAGSDMASTTVELTPEPGSMALACLGLIGMTFARRRRIG